MFYTPNNWIASALLTVVAVLLYKVYRLVKHYDYWKNLGIIGPKPLPIFANLLSLRKNVHTVKIEWMRKYGKLYGIYYAFAPELVICDPELIKLIAVKEFDKFRNKRDHAVKHPIFGLSLGFLRDDHWKRVRTIVSPSFTSAKLKAMYASVNESVEHFLLVLDEYATSGEDVDLKIMMGKLSANIILKQVFGQNINTYDENNDNIFLRNLRNMIDLSAVKMFVMMIMPRFILQIFSITGGVQSKPADFIVDVMKAIIKDRKQSTEKHNDLLQLLINAEYSDTEQELSQQLNDRNQVNEDNKKENETIKESKKISGGSNKLSENEVIAQSATFYFGGFETTASTLTLCLFELAANQQIQHRLYEEVKTVVDTNGNISYDTLMQLPYLDAVLSETLRKYPIALAVRREAAQEYKLDEYNITIPKHTSIEINIYSVHHNEEYYPKPELFIPDRFLPENRHKIKAYSYMPFSLGPRNCVGMRFAQMEAKLVLALMVFRFKLVNSHNIEKVTFKPDLRILVPENFTIHIHKR